ncbi:hypothetical protein VNO77_16027 [Canavalia gladiata]|uniref:Uncharacterized protein n=1 Tax=Canavalia gladiata TaxID=3824 RepID=A0AAN9QW88_CANGL
MTIRYRLPLPTHEIVLTSKSSKAQYGTTQGSLFTLVEPVPSCRDECCKSVQKLKEEILTTRCKICRAVRVWKMCFALVHTHVSIREAVMIFSAFILDNRHSVKSLSPGKVIQCLFDKISLVLYTDAVDAAMVRLFSSVSCLSKGEFEPPF